LVNDGWIYTPLTAPAVLMVTAFYLIDAYNSKTDMLSLGYTSEHIIAVVFAFFGTLLVTSSAQKVTQRFLREGLVCKLEFAR
jgi:hypothetical protein